MTSFKNLKIDYLSLNSQFCNIRQIKKIADFLANLGCKSTLVDESERKSYVLTKIHKHRYSAEFVVNLNKYWKGTTLRFNGKNAQQFYNDLRLQNLDWCIFNLTYTNLGRIDLYYDRKLKKMIQIYTFFF